MAEGAPALLQFGRFSIVGALSAALNTVIIVLFREALGLSVTAAVVSCFVLVTISGFFLNRAWTFGVRGADWTGELSRYFLVVLIGLALTLGVVALLARFGIPYWIATLTAAGAMAPVSFVLHQLWSFSMVKSDSGNGLVDPRQACGAGGACSFGEAPRYRIETGHPLQPVVTLHSCRNCGHMVTLPSMDDVAPLYAGRDTQDFQASDPSWLLKLKRRFQRRLAADILKQTGMTPKLAIDYGTGSGRLAGALAERLGRGSRVVGVDFFDSAPVEIGAADYASFAGTEALAGRTDLVACFHVIEHDDDPQRVLARIRALLRPGGTAVIEVPNGDCVWNPWFGAASANWYAPYHRVHFSRTSLRAAVERAGFVVERQIGICGPTWGMSIASVLNLKNVTPAFALAIMGRPLQIIAERATRRPSALRIIARRA